MGWKYCLFYNPLLTITNINHPMACQPWLANYFWGGCLEMLHFPVYRVLICSSDDHNLLVTGSINGLDHLAHAWMSRISFFCFTAEDPFENGSIRHLRQRTQIHADQRCVTPLMICKLVKGSASVKGPAIAKSSVVVNDRRTPNDWNILKLVIWFEKKCFLMNLTTVHDQG